VGGGYLSVFIWVVGSYLIVSELGALIGIYVYEINCDFTHNGSYGSQTLVPGAGSLRTIDVPNGMWVPHRASILEVWTN